MAGVLPRRPRRYLRVLLAAAIVAGAAVALGAALRHTGPGIARMLGRPGAVPLTALSVAANVAGLLLAMQSWRVLLVESGSPVGVLAGGRIFFLGQLSKYLPGRVWGVVTHVELGSAVGVPARRMVTAYAVSLGVTTLTGAAVGLLVGPAVLGGHALVLAVPALLVVAAVAVPELVSRPVAYAARLARRPIAGTTRRGTRRAIIVALVSWLVSGVHLWALALLLGAPAVRALPVCAGAFALATVAGSLALVVPDGWGVREVTVMAGLATVLPWTSAGLAAVGSRLVCVVSEVLTSVVVIAWAQRRSRRAGPPTAATAPAAASATPGAPIHEEGGTRAAAHTI